MVGIDSGTRSGCRDFAGLIQGWRERHPWLPSVNPFGFNPKPRAESRRAPRLLLDLQPVEFGAAAHAIGVRGGRAGDCSVRAGGCRGALQCSQ